MVRFAEPALDVVWAVLNRNIHVDGLGELYRGLNEPERRKPLMPGSNIAFGFDTNAVFRLGLGGTAGANAVDFLRQYEGPVILPGQCVQEVWNNALSGVEPTAKRLKSKFDQLREEMASIDQQMGKLGEAAENSLDDLLKEHGHLIEPDLLEVFGGVLEALLEVGTSRYVPRIEFSQLAEIRKQTKAPPGFKDKADNHGDFFVWADFLYGLAGLQEKNFDSVVFVTNDSKSDWSRNGVPHPLLVAEVVSISGVPFRLWTVEMFKTHANAILS